MLSPGISLYDIPALLKHLQKVTSRIFVNFHFIKSILSAYFCVQVPRVHYGSTKYASALSYFLEPFQDYTYFESGPCPILFTSIKLTPTKGVSNSYPS